MDNIYIEFVTENHNEMTLKVDGASIKEGVSALEFVRLFLDTIGSPMAIVSAWFISEQEYEEIKGDENG